jgi:Transglycosylase SLT domain
MTLLPKNVQTESSMLQALGRRIFSAFFAWLVALAISGIESTASGSSGMGALVPGGGATLDQVAFAVDGAESSHGADARMWRSEPNGPQGPMQVSAAAAADAGGGDRFDEGENRALGRAYLARLYRRYGSWPDAVAAYNWGPGHMDVWISGGRPIDQMPPAVARYRTRVLVGSGLQLTAGDAAFGSINGRFTRLGMLRLLARRQMADRHRLGSGRDAVALLYTEILRATDLTLR